jgi:hypothetical protein
MNQHADTPAHVPTPRAPRFTVYAPRFTLYALIALLLSACLFDTTPKTPVPPLPTNTPRPTPTDTPGVLPIRQPTAETSPPPRVTATPPGGVATVETRADGQILYIALRGGRRDIMSIDATGGNRRQLVAGTYEAPIWSPDGSRFAAYGATTPGGLSDQLAIFNGEGRPLGRYPLDGIGVGPPTWSPDGRYLLCLLRDPTVTSGPRSAWVVAGDGMRQLPLPDNATPWRWTPDNRLAYIVYPSGGQRRVSQSNPLTVWSLDPDGDQPRQEARGVIAPLGWSSNGQTFYAFDGLIPDQSNNPTTTIKATNVVAIDRRTGSTRTLISATNAASAAWRGTPAAPVGTTTHWFEGGSVSPAGGHLALLAYTSGPTGGQMTVALVDENGQLRARDATRPSTPTFAWSPGGTFVAYIIPTGNSGGELHILAPNGQPPYTYPVTAAWVPGTYAPSWSPDSRWVAIVGPDGLTITATVGSARTFPLDTEGTIISPTWRPSLAR